MNCNLAAVSWVTPDGHWSDHPGTTIDGDGGPSWVAAIVNAIGGAIPPYANCGYWANTVILIVWDDWGGFYDHVGPPYIGYPNSDGLKYVYGFRVPLLVVSAYSKVGYVSGTAAQGGKQPPYIHDFGSILNFTEHVFGLGPIGDQNYPYADYLAPDGHFSYPPSQYSLSDFFFDFGQQPRSFIPITGAKYQPSCFTDPLSCYSNYPQDPDNDVIEEAQ